MTRAVGWTVAYFAAVLMPAAVAIAVDPLLTVRPPRVESAAALGFFAFAIILAQLALVSRLRVISQAFGTDALIQFHQWVGLGAVVIAALHPVLLAPRQWSGWLVGSGSLATRTGAIALWAVVLLVLTTVLRRRLLLTYEWWRAIHLALSVLAGTATLVHVLLAGRYASAPPVATLVLTYVAAAGAVVVGYRVVRPWRLRAHPWEVVANTEEGASTRTVRVRPVNHAGFHFAAGQFAWLITGESPFSPQQHPLSISSSADRPADGAIEFSIKALGDWSGSTVPTLASGTRVWVDGPFGAFRLPAGSSPVLMIAGGIGIAPFRSMLLTMRDRGDTRPVRLVYAANDPSRVLFAGELATLAAQLPLTVTYVFENPPASWTGERGFVTADVLRRCGVTSGGKGAAGAAAANYICGPPAMLRAVEAALHEIGVPRSRIHSERFHVV